MLNIWILKSYLMIIAGSRDLNVKPLAWLCDALAYSPTGPISKHPYQTSVLNCRSTKMCVFTDGLWGRLVHRLETQMWWDTRLSVQYRRRKLWWVGGVWNPVRLGSLSKLVNDNEELMKASRDNAHQCTRRESRELKQRVNITQDLVSTLYHHHRGSNSFLPDMFICSK